MTILITGGAGYIGSHTCLELIRDGHSVVIVDNLSNSKLEAVKRLRLLTRVSIPFYNIDITIYGSLKNIFKNYKFDAVIHFAGLKAIGESVNQPLLYYKNNIDSTLNLCEEMRTHKVKNLIFSSSATVYGIPKSLPLNEESPIGHNITNPYGQTKYMIEQILKDLVGSDKDWNVISLRYFNPFGADNSGKIGEDPHGVPNNLMPYISQVAVGKLKELNIFGNDYQTPDGTGVRDYIHVTDLALGHVAALKKIDKNYGFNAYNLGTGKGVSVIEAVNLFQEATGVNIPYVFKPRRPGDVDELYADVKKAQSALSWRATMSFKQACKDSWHWQTGNPNGYE